MIKLRGINVWPEALGDIVSQNEKTNGEYFCILERENKGGSTARDEMTILVEPKYVGSDRYELQMELENQFKQKMGVKMQVQIVDQDSLRSLTGHGVRAKLKRYEDRR